MFGGCVFVFRLQFFIIIKIQQTQSRSLFLSHQFHRNVNEFVFHFKFFFLCLGLSFSIIFMFTLSLAFFIFHRHYQHIIAGNGCASSFRRGREMLKRQWQIIVKAKLRQTKQLQWHRFQDRREIG